MTGDCSEDFTGISRHLFNDPDYFQLVAKLEEEMAKSNDLEAQVFDMAKRLAALEDEVAYLRRRRKPVGADDPEFRIRAGYHMPPHIKSYSRFREKETDPKDLIGCLAMCVEDSDETLRHLHEDE